MHDEGDIVGGGIVCDPAGLRVERRAAVLALELLALVGRRIARIELRVGQHREREAGGRGGRAAGAHRDRIGAGAGGRGGGAAPLATARQQRRADRQRGKAGDAAQQRPTIGHAPQAAPFLLG